MVSRTGSYLSRLLLGLVTLLLALVTAGCWDRREINELAFVTSLAADLEGEQRVITAEIIQPAAATGGSGGMGGGGGGGGGRVSPQRQAIIISERGYTLLAAGRAYALKLPRRAYIAHTNAILVGEDMARQGIREVLSFVDRNPELRRTTLILITRGPARDVLIKAQGGLESTLGREIVGLKKWVRVSGYGFIPDVHQVFQELSAGTGATVIPVVELGLQPIPPRIGAGTTGGGAQAAKSAGPGPVEEPEIVRTLRLAGSGLFRQDKLVGWFDERQTRGWAWARNKVSRAILDLPCEDDTKVSVEIIESRASISIDTQNGQLRGEIKLKIDGHLLEQQCSVDFTQKETTRLLESQMTEQVKAEINSALVQAQAAGTDVFNFGATLHHKNPKLWRQLQDRWEEEFKRLPVTIKVEAKLRRTGLTKRPWQPWKP